MRHHRIRTATQHLTPFILAFMLLACGGSGNGSGSTGGTTPVPGGATAKKHGAEQGRRGREDCADDEGNVIAAVERDERARSGREQVVRASGRKADEDCEAERPAPVPVTNGSKSENYIVYQDVAAATGGSMASASFRLTATLGQSSPTGESSSAGYTLSGGSRPN